MRYLITPQGLPTICACGKHHTLNHALQCKIGGLIGGRDDEARDDLGCVATQAISPHVVHNDPRVQPCWDGKKGKIARVASRTQNAEAEVRVLRQKDKEKEGNIYGDLIIRHLWKHQVDTVIDVRITDTDAKSYISCPLET
eukprot:10162263-Ditylum_brightwellii.AAC.1